MIVWQDDVVCDFVFNVGEWFVLLICGEGLYLWDVDG